MSANAEDYDGIPYTELVFNEIDWSEAVEHIRDRSSRKGRSEFNVEPEWATEAVADPHRLVGSAESRSGLTIKILGWSPSSPNRNDPNRRGRLLKVIIAPKDQPPTGRWWGATAMDANESDQRRYEHQEEQ